MSKGTVNLGFIRLGGICLLLCGFALTSPLSAEESNLERAKKLLGILEAAEAGHDAGVSPKALAERLGQAEQGLAAHLRTYPSDVEALVVSARLDRFRQVLEPIVLSPGQEPPDPKAAYAPAHEKLNRALALQPNNAEARYWKARLYGLRHPVFRQGRLNYAASDLDQAIKYSKEAVMLEPANDVYREAFALYLVEGQRPAEAIEVMRSVADKQRLSYLLLNDLEAVPIPKTATLSPVDSESFAQQQMARGRFQDYPQLRVRFFVVPTSAIKLEEFYSSYWDRFKFFSQGDPQRAGKAEIQVFAQHLIKGRDNLQPTGTDSKIPEQPRSGILLSVIELRNLPAERRRQTPAGFDMPDVGDTFCYLVVVNYRPSK
jgi:tetratricopeptide (TPR) repeat protein